MRKFNSKKIMYVVNHASFFVSHRLPLADEAIKRGATVGLCVGIGSEEEQERRAYEVLSERPIAVSKCQFKSSSVNVFAEIRGFISVLLQIRQFAPDVVHCVSPKGIIYGGLSAHLLRVSRIVVAVSGMGYLFTENNKSIFERAVVKAFSLVFKLILTRNKTRVIVQNGRDYQHMLSLGVAEPCISLIEGSGVDVDRFDDTDELIKEDMVLFPARLLREKGFDQFVAAAAALKAEFPDWRFVIAGQAGYDNPSAVSEKEVIKACAEHGIEWLGHVNNMVPLFESASIVCLPSYYREGLPKALVEAAAASCAVITTDFPGCKDAIIPGVTGELVTPKCALEVENTLRKFITSPRLRKNYGRRGRELAHSRFNLQTIVESNLALYVG